MRPFTILLLSITLLCIFLVAAVPALNSAEAPAPTESEQIAANSDYGTTPHIDPHANAQVEAAVEALKTGKHPERLSTLMYSEEEFNLEKYRTNPSAYLNIPEPGRAFQPAQPGPGVQRLQPNSRPFQEVRHGEFVELSVRGLPQTPITFTSTDLGIFENQLTTISVETDDEGYAGVRMYGTPGTINDVNILAASPVTSGQVKFIVRVKKAEPALAL